MISCSSNNDNNDDDDDDNDNKGTTSSSLHDSLNFDDSSSDHINEMVMKRQPRRFPMPKKLGSDRLLLVSKALHETPTYKSISPTLQQQRKSLKPPLEECSQPKRVCFRAVDQVNEYIKDYAEEHHKDLWFSDAEFSSIFEREDRDYTACYGEMSHTKHILQLWGMCSRGTNNSPRSVVVLNNVDEDDNTSKLPQEMATAVDTLFREAPHPRARGLENRIITGIRNHRQKSVQSFLQHYREMTTTAKATAEQQPDICPRYLKFSQTAACFARALAEGDARIVLQQYSMEGDVERQEDDDWDIM
jgi:hypothetical protein